MNKFTYEKKGITLVALVITIIILIILAGISINMLLGEGGLITKAQQAKENMELASIEEQERLNTMYTSLATGSRITYNEIADNQELQATLSSATAKQEHILKPYTAYIDGALREGTMTDKSGQTVTTTQIQSSSTNVSITIPENAYYDNTSKVSVSTADLLGNIFNGNMTRVTPSATVKSWTADKDYPILFVTGENTNFTSSSSSTHPYPSINGSQLSILVGNTWASTICSWVFLVTDVKAGDVFTVPSDCEMDIKTLSRLIS